MRFILLIPVNVKMPKYAFGILTFMGRMNNWLLWFKHEDSFGYDYFDMRLIMLSSVEHEKSCIALVPDVLAWLGVCPVGMCVAPSFTLHAADSFMETILSHPLNLLKELLSVSSKRICT